MSIKRLAADLTVKVFISFSNDKMFVRFEITRFRSVNVARNDECSIVENSLYPLGGMLN